MPANPGEVGATQRLEGFRPQRVKLQVDFQPRLERRQRLHELRLLGNPDAVGIEHQMADGPPFRRRDDLQDLRMDCGFTAGQLQKVGLALAGHQRIHHPFNFCQRPMGSLRRGTVGKADRTGEIARLVHINQRQARMLLVVRAEPAIIGAAKLRAGLHLQGPVAGFQIIMAEFVVSGVRRNQSLLNPVGLAALQIIDIAILNDDLGWHQGIAASRRAMWSARKKHRA